MRPLMYKQRPAYPALIAAVCSLIFGALTCWALKDRVDAGEGTSASILLVACISVGTSGALLIAAFARYQFTHLWKRPEAAHSKTNTVKPAGRDTR